MSRYILLMFAIILASCAPQERESPTRGHITVFATESIAPLIQQEGDEFHRIYPAVSVMVRPTLTREAIVLLLNDSVTAIAIDRLLNKEEQTVVQDARLPVMGTKIGQDALVAIVHPKNPLRRLLLSELQGLLSGTINRWSQIPSAGMNGLINMVLTGRNSGVLELLEGHFFHLEAISMPRVFESQQAVLEFVGRDPQAVGIVSFSALNATNNASNGHAVRRLALMKTGEVEAVQVSQAAIYSRSYPLSYSLFLYVREKKAGPGSGFATFIASQAGQKIIQQSGIVPMNIPSRTIQLVQE